jgi:hypothetical protein
MSGSKTLTEFLAAYDPDGTRIVADIEAVRDADGYSPLIIVRCGRFAAVLALMPIDGKYLDIDVHPFTDGQEATAGAFRVAVLISKRGEVPVPDSPLVQAAREAQALNEPVSVTEQAGQEK